MAGALGRPRPPIAGHSDIQRNVYQIQDPELVQVIFRAGWRESSAQDTQRCQRFLENTSPFDTQQWNSKALEVASCFFGLSIASHSAPNSDRLPLAVRFVPQLVTEGAIDLAVCERVRQATGESGSIVGIANALESRFSLDDESLLWVVVVTEVSSWYLVADQLEFVGSSSEEALRSMVFGVSGRRRVISELGLGDNSQ
jgi:hypothetical protein